MLSPNDGYNETGLTMQSAGPIREAWQPILFSCLFKGSEFWPLEGHKRMRHVCLQTLLVSAKQTYANC